MKEFNDVGFDVGGPIVRDRWWAWGAYGRTDGTLFTLNGDPDGRTLENVAFKTTRAAHPRIRPEFLYFRGNKIKNGRGASPLRAPETTWDQKGPTPLYQGPGQHRRRRQRVPDRAGRIRRQRLLVHPARRRRVGVSRRWPSAPRHYYYYATDRPDYSAHVDGNWFRGRHEITFGGSWRNTRDDEFLEYPGNGVDSLHNATSPRRGACRRGSGGRSSPRARWSTQSLYAGDTIAGRLTAKLALRFDRGYASMLESAQRANPGFPSSAAGNRGAGRGAS